MIHPGELIQAFVRAINEHDIGRVSDLMSDDHCFVDSLDGQVVGRETMVAAWIAYFRMVPDYWIEIEHIMIQENTVALFGRAGGSCVLGGKVRGEWSVPAAWRAVVNAGRISRWQVYADNEPIRKLQVGAMRGL